MKKVVFIKGFIKSKLFDLLGYSSIFAILLITFFLYEVPLEVISYSLLLCLFPVAGILSYQYHRYENNVLILERTKLQQDITELNLPEVKEDMERLYQEVIARYQDEIKKVIHDLEYKHMEQMEYYTMWAHQIKTPVSALKLLVQAKAFDSGEQLTEIFKIEQYVEMALQYIRMTDMSNDLSIKRHLLEDLVKQAVRKYATLFIHKKISIELGDLQDSILTDEKWFVFVLEQIISNAIKYNETGGYIKIYLEQDNSSTLIIEDNGIGIIEEDVERVFEKGYTGLNGRMDKRSTGIGLYLCKSICKKLSHSIKIESKQSKGTKVRIDYHMRILEVE